MKSKAVSRSYCVRKNSNFSKGSKHRDSSMFRVLFASSSKLNGKISTFKALSNKIPLNMGAMPLHPLCISLMIKVSIILKNTVAFMPIQVLEITKNHWRYLFRWSLLYYFLRFSKIIHFFFVYNILPRESRVIIGNVRALVR